jgi:hypothetical protein
MYVQISIGERYERLQISEYDLIRMPKDQVNTYILHFLRGSKIVQEYRKQRDTGPKLP